MIGFFIWLVSAVLIFFGPAAAFTAGNSVPPPQQQETPPVAYRLLTPGETEIDEFALIAVNDGPVQGIDCAWGYSYLEFNISRAAHTEDSNLYLVKFSVSFTPGYTAAQNDFELAEGVPYYEDACLKGGTMTVSVTDNGEAGHCIVIPRSAWRYAGSETDLAEWDGTRFYDSSSSMDVPDETITASWTFEAGSRDADKKATRIMQTTFLVEAFPQESREDVLTFEFTHTLSAQRQLPGGLWETLKYTDGAEHKQELVHTFSISVPFSL